MNDRVKIIIKKTIASISIILMMSSLLSCSMTNNSNDDTKNRNRIISADSNWYEGEIIDVKMDLDSSRIVDFLDTSFAGADEKYIVLFSDGYYKVDNWDVIKKNSDFAIMQAVIIDRNTKRTCKTIDLYNVIEETDWPEKASYCNGQLVIRCESWESKTDEYYSADKYIDIETEKIIETHRISQQGNLDSIKIYNIGQYRLEVLYDANSTPGSYVLRTHLQDGKYNDAFIKFDGKEMYGIPVVLNLNDTTALIPIEMQRDYKYFKLELTTNKLTELNANDYKWLDVDRLVSSYNGSDGKVYITSTQGISLIDIDNKNTELIFSFNQCGVNRQYLKGLDIVDFSDDSFLLCGQYNSMDMFTSQFVNNYAVVEFKKAKKNPHAGKKIIELYAPDGDVDTTISDAIIRFNEESKKYYIELSNRYNKHAYINYSGIKSLDDYDSALLRADAKMGNELAMDIMNGVGPDILMNTSSLGQLNNDNYLVDLSPYLQTLDSDKYFTNIINGAKSNGKLYQLPISYTIEGIQTSPEYAGKTKIGFTTDEYKKFLSETLNGKDVIESGQALYFAKLFNEMSEEFIVDGKVDLNNRKFVDIAEYVNDSVQRNSLAWDIIDDEEVEYTDFTTKGNKTACYCNCPGISGYLVKRAQIKDGIAILGIPSSDGRGPAFGTGVSVAVSKNAVNIDACIEFVRILLSDEIQNKLVMSDKFVINRESLRNGCRAAVDYFNTKEGSQNMFDYVAGTYVTSRTLFTTEDIDNLEKIILSCSKSNASDAAITTIILEEMPAYFQGQKELTKVVIVLQDRMQKVLDERV